MSLPLFDDREPFDRTGLAASLRRLAAQNIWIGASSWKYEGWIGQVYTRDRYLQRGSFSTKLFEAECLREYADTFPIVGGDFSFYQFPSEAYWKRLFALAPEELRFAFKVPEEITVQAFPSHPRHGGRSGLRNPSYLDPALFAEAFLGRLAPYRERISALILEFGTFSKQGYAHVRDFVQDLSRFLSAVPPGFRYSVEVRNSEFLTPEYFHCLRSHGAANVFSSWTRMPPLPEQIRMEEAFTANFTVCRALLRPARKYEDAVRIFSPYEQIRDPYPEGREALRELIRYARDNRQSLFLFINNRFEGNAPLTIGSIVD
jgi:uncharacterized protein YecE (DUF72 family)